MTRKITYYNRQLFNFIKALPVRLKARYVVLTERMLEWGPDLGMPHTRAMGQGLFELRVKVQEGIARVFYCTQAGNEIIILHAFIKKTQETPNKVLNLAMRRLKEVKHHE